jgi:hypothetical protein
VQLDEDETEEDQRVAHMASHRSWSQPAQEEHYESYGFIQVLQAWECSGSVDVEADRGGPDWLPATSFEKHQLN